MANAHFGAPTSDNDHLKPMEGSKNIQEAGIHHDMLFVGLNFVQFDSKKNTGEKYNAAEFVFRNATTGLEHKELYFEPASSPDQIKFFKKLGEFNNNKWVETREATKEEMVQLLQQEFGLFCLDLADAMRFDVTSINKGMSTAKSFKEAVEIFKKMCPPSLSTKISIKLLFENNKKNETSFLKLHPFPIMYYPFKADIFDRYTPNVPSRLQISDYEFKNSMKREFTGNRAPQGTAPMNTAEAPKFKDETISFPLPDDNNKPAGGDSNLSWI